jgi:hypothetical protein
MTTGIGGIPMARCLRGVVGCRVEGVHRERDCCSDTGPLRTLGPVALERWHTFFRDALRHGPIPGMDLTPEAFVMWCDRTAYLAVAAVEAREVAWRHRESEMIGEAEAEGKPRPIPGRGREG